MLPGTWNIALAAGNTLAQTVTWKSGDTPEDAEPVDLTGYTAEMIVADQEGATILVLSTETDGGITLGGADGTIALFAQTAGISPGCYSYTLTLTSGPGEDGVITTLLAGAFGLT